MKHKLQLLFVLLLIASLAPTAYADSGVPRATPALLELAKSRQNETIKVIVQRADDIKFQKESLGRMGGKITKELSFIDGFAADIPASSVEALAQAPGVRWVSLDAPIRTAGSLPPAGNTCNLLINGDFEDGFSQWTDWSNTLQQSLSSNAYAGGKALYLGTSAGAVSQSLSAATAGETYSATGMFLRTAGSPYMNVGFDFFDSNWNEIGEAYTYIPESSTYTPVTLSGVAPSGTKYATLWIWKDVNGSLLIDSLKVSKGSALSGTNCSGYQQSAGYNLLSNGGFESGWSGWSIGSNDVQIVQPGYAGGKAARINSPAGGFGQSIQTATAGTTYTVKGMFQRPAGSPWSGFGIDFYNANWVEISEAYTEIPESNSYLPVSVSGVAPAGTVHIGLWVSKNSGSYLLVDNLTVSAGDIPAAYSQSLGASNLWNAPKPLDGRNVTIAVVDSGITANGDLSARIVGSVNFSSSSNTNDEYGHGNHVAGIIAGNGNASGGMYRGIAPGAKLLNVKVSNNQGMSLMSDMLEGLQWIYNNRATYNIKVVNISQNSTVAEPYKVSPLSAAVEILWFNGVTVVVSAGNNGQAGSPVTLYPPANDPFVITVGATDDRGTYDVQDDIIENFSAYGTTENGYSKPDIVTPGRNIISLLSSTSSTIYTNYPLYRVNNSYFRMSGTSMAAPMVSGAVALLLQDEPGLNPDQIKYRLMSTANKSWTGYNAAKAGAGYLNIEAAIYGSSSNSSNTGIPISQMLYTGSTPVTWSSVNWNSVNWNSVNWNTVNWNTVNWNTVNWNTVNWNTATWASSLWEQVEQSTPEPNGPAFTFTVPQEWIDANQSNQVFLPVVTR